MEARERMEEAEGKIEDWIRNAMREAQQEVLAQDERLDDSDLKRIKDINEELKRRGDGSLWSGVDFNIYVEEGDDGNGTVELNTFGVPLIPPDIDGLDEDDRRLYNDALSDCGVHMCEAVEEQFEDWKSG